MPIGSKMYEAAQKEASPNDDVKPTEGGEDTPVEGEVVDDNKKE